MLLFVENARNDRDVNGILVRRKVRSMTLSGPRDGGVMGMCNQERITLIDCT